MYLYLVQIKVFNFGPDQCTDFGSGRLDIVKLTLLQSLYQHSAIIKLDLSQIGINQKFWLAWTEIKNLGPNISAHPNASN